MVKISASPEVPEQARFLSVGMGVMAMTRSAQRIGNDADQARGEEARHR